jgi:hypothetical protein
VSARNLLVYAKAVTVCALATPHGLLGHDWPQLFSLSPRLREERAGVREATPSTRENIDLDTFTEVRYFETFFCHPEPG